MDDPWQPSPSSVIRCTLCRAFLTSKDDFLVSA